MLKDIIFNSKLGNKVCSNGEHLAVNFNFPVAKPLRGERLVISTLSTKFIEINCLDNGSLANTMYQEKSLVCSIIGTNELDSCFLCERYSGKQKRLLNPARGYKKSNWFYAI